MALELRHQPELGNLDLTFDTAIQLNKPSRDTIDKENVHLIVGIVDDRGQGRVRELLPARPVPVFSHCIVQEAIPGDGWPLGMKDVDSVPGKGPTWMGVGGTLQIKDMGRQLGDYS